MTEEMKTCENCGAEGCSGCGTSRCGGMHHMAGPVLLVLLGLSLWLTLGFQKLNPALLGHIIPILIIVWGGIKLFRRTCKCC